MNAPSNLLHLVEEAVRLLVVGECGIKQRLLAAYNQKLQYVRTAEVPAELAPRLVSIYARFGHNKASDTKNAIKPALNRMEVSSAVKLAADIFEFNNALSQGQYH